MKTKMQFTKSQKDTTAKKNKLVNDEIENLIRLSQQYIANLNKLAEVKIKKNILVRKENWEKASNERDSELTLLTAANSIFKDMKSSRRKINVESNYKKVNIGGYAKWTPTDYEKKYSGRPKTPKHKK